jgi:hypothetical protein
MCLNLTHFKIIVSLLFYQQLLTGSKLRKADKSYKNHIYVESDTLHNVLDKLLD